LLADDTSVLTPMMRDLGRLTLDMWNHTEQAIKDLNSRIQQLSNSSELCKRLQSVPGIGPLLATAIVAAVGNASAFKRARDLSAWIGIVPRQLSTGGNTRLVGISKRGNSYVRRLFIQGARAVWVWRDKHPDDSLQRWVTQVGQRRHSHVAVCALANKLARISWAVMRSGEDFRANYRAAPAQLLSS
jgi:transposase